MYSQSFPAGERSPIVDIPAPLEPDAARQRLGLLISRYLQEGTSELARSVVAQLEALWEDPCLHDPELFCAYRRLVRHWRWLSV